jgi:hypothetical protein
VKARPVVQINTMTVFCSDGASVMGGKEGVGTIVSEKYT